MSRPARAVITFEGGLNEYIEPSRLPVGQASVLENWINEPDGSLRSKVGWIAQANTGQPTNRQVRGIGTIHLTAGDTHLVASRSTDSELKFYSIANADLASGAVAMVLRDTVNDLQPEGGSIAGNHHRHYVPMVDAFGYLIYGNHAFYRGGLTTDGLRRWSGTSSGPVPNSAPVVGRGLCYYRDRLFTGGGEGSAAKRAALNWSGLADHEMWDVNDLNNPAGVAYVDRNEPGYIECITPFQDGILIGKTNSLWYLIGRNPFNSQLERLDVGNAAPGKSLCVTPYGAFVAGKKECWLFDGRHPEPENKRVSTSYGLKGEYLTTAYQDGCVYIADQGTDDILVYNFEQDTWRKENHSKRLATLHSYDSRLLGGPTDATDFPLIGYRDIPSGNRGPDSVGTTYRATTPRTWFGNAIGPVTVRHAYLKVRQRGTTGPGVTVRLYRNDVLEHTKVIGPETTTGVHRYRIDSGPTGYVMHWEFEQTLAAGETSNVDLEEIVIEYHSENPR